MSSQDVYAALDLGSNSFHLLVARLDGSKILVLDRHKESVRLAEGLDSAGQLSAAACAAALESLQRFAERLRSTPISQCRVVGTNALRTVRNGESFLEQAQAILGYPVHIISGAEEARLVYRGVALDLSPQDQPRLVVDIGGGSTELIIGRARPERVESLGLGCLEACLRFFPDGKLSEKSYQRALLAVRSEVQPVVSRFAAGNWDEVVGASGTIRALEAVLSAMELSRDHSISLENLDALAASLVRCRHVDELSWPALSPERRRLVPGGLVVLHGLFRELAINRMQVSGYSIREGIILDLAGRQENRDVRADTVADMMRQYRVDAEQAGRVSRFALSLLACAREDFGADYARFAQLLDWAASLHEIGLAVAHSGYHKHGAYLLLHSDMPGFSRLEQKALSFLVLNHRRKLRQVDARFGFHPDWRLVQILRLACLFSRRRDDGALPADVTLSFKKSGAELGLNAQWLEDHPLSREDFANEQRYLRAQNLKLLIKEF